MKKVKNQSSSKLTVVRSRKKDKKRIALVKFTTESKGLTLMNFRPKEGRFGPNNIFELAVRVIQVGIYPRCQTLLKSLEKDDHLKNSVQKTGSGWTFKSELKGDEISRIALAYFTVGRCSIGSIENQSLDLQLVLPGLLSENSVYDVVIDFKKGGHLGDVISLHIGDFTIDISFEIERKASRGLGLISGIINRDGSYTSPKEMVTGLPSLKELQLELSQEFPIDYPTSHIKENKHV